MFQIYMGSLGDNYRRGDRGNERRGDLRYRERVYQPDEYELYVVKAGVQALAHGAFQGMMSAATGGSFWTGFAAGALSSIAASAWSGGTDTQWQGLGGKFADSGLGMIAFGTVAGGAGAQLTGGNFWVGAATGLMVSACNHWAHEIQIRNEIESKYPKLYKTLSKLKSFVKTNDDVLNSLSETSGYSPKEVLRSLSVKNLSTILTVDEQGDWGHFDNSNPSKISIRASLIRGLEMVKLPANLNETSFFTGVTVLHEFVHYARYWNGLSSMINIHGTNYEAGQVFETNAFGRILGLNGNSQIMNSNGWEF